MKNPFFSICIPNFNYGNYIGETIESVLNQDYANFEICIADNNSTDNSWEVISEFVNKYPEKIIATKNNVNIGFAGNLDLVSSLGNGKYIIMLSSDDLMEPSALKLYHTCISEDQNENNLYNSSVTQFNDSNQLETLRIGMKSKIWSVNCKSDKWSKFLKKDCYEQDSADLLRRGLLEAKSPFNFVSLCYSRELYKLSGGYSGSRMMNPDKWFHFKLSALANKAIYIDEICFKYRWHSNNQTSQQTQSGALKFWIDEYRTSFEVSNEMLVKSGLKIENIRNSFITKSVHPYVLKFIMEGHIKIGLRVLLFGIACYPSISFKKISTYALLILLFLGPIGKTAAKLRFNKRATAIN